MIYIKKLTKSDLTIIKRFWRPNLKQEAIVLSKRYMKSLGDDYFNMVRGVPIPIQMIFFGPEGNPAIVKSDASIGRMTHDWRIQSCSLEDPVEDTERFSILIPGDLFVFSLENDGDVRIGRGLFISQASQEDISLYNLLLSYVNKIVETETINTLLLEDNINERHPVYSVINETSDFEFEETAPFEVEPVTSTELTDSLEAGLIGATGKRGKLSKEELTTLLTEVDRIGSDGEKYFDIWLETKPEINSKRVAAHVWIASEFATAPYDFEIIFDDGLKVFIELKSTSGPFKNNIYLSSAELRTMSNSSHDVILARIYDLDNEPKFRFAFTTKFKAEEILSTISFPTDQVGLVSVWVKPGFFDFQEEEIKWIGY